jgi:hypothetical protein
MGDMVLYIRMYTRHVHEAGLGCDGLLSLSATSETEASAPLEPEVQLQGSPLAQACD